MINTSCQVSVYEIDRKEITPIGGPKVILNSRDAYRQLIEIEFEGKRFSVKLRELESAIKAVLTSGS